MLDESVRWSGGHDGLVAHERVDRSWFRAVLEPFGAAVDDLHPLGGGAVNHVYRCDRVDSSPIVLRFPVDPLRSDEFPVEAWAASAAGRIGIPTATVLGHGIERGIPFAVSEFVAPDPRPIDRPWTWLGSCARRVGTIPLRGAPASLYTRFGSDLQHAWAAHLEYNRSALGDDDQLGLDGAYGSASAADVHDLLARLSPDRYDFGLAHGDLAPRNLVSRGPDEPPVLIDWGAAETGPTPWTDARRVLAWTFLEGSVDRRDHDEFMAGAGLSSSEDHRTLVSMTALHLLDVTRWAREQRPDLYGEYVERCRAGLERLLAIG